MFPTRTISVSIDRPLDQVYAFAHQPENFIEWASGLAASLHKEGEDWIADTPAGRANVRFSATNAYGVLDHRVVFPNRAEIYIPLRVIANDDGCEVSLTLFSFTRDGRRGFRTRWGNGREGPCAAESDP